jgi:crotonobetaine/carnitine-CoA ligase
MSGRESERHTVLGLLQGAVDDVPERLFLDFDGVPFTYGDAHIEVQRIAQGLRSLGVQPGQTVGGMLDNNSDAIFGWMAANTLGAIWVGVNTALKGDFLRHVLVEADVKVLLIEPEYLDRLHRIEGEIPTLEHVLYRGGREADLGRHAGGRLDDLRGDASVDGLSFAPHPFDLTCLVVTGGTTGPSKACMLQHNYIVNFARQVNEVSGRKPDEVSLNPLPAYHMNLLSNTVTSSLLLRGSGAVLPRFSLSGFWLDVERTGARVVNILGSMISLIARMPDTPEMERCRGQIRAVVGAPFPADLQEIWKERFGLEVFGLNGYGLTEAVAITSVPAGEFAKPGSAGKANDDFEVRIVDDEDDEVPVGTVGEIVCRPKRSAVMFAGYWKRPEATLAAMRNMWFHSGDLGRWDDDGFLWFVDRKKDYLRRRGENISSMEVEGTFLKHPAVLDVACTSIPSEVTEDDLKITAVLREGHDASPEELFRWAVEELPYFALPRYIELRDELPKSPLGRTFKYQLRDEGLTEGTWDRDAAGVEFDRR